MARIFDCYQNFQFECAADIVTLQKMIEQENILKFLARLNPEYEPIHIQLLRKEPHPPSQEIFAYVWRDEIRKGIIHHNGS